MMEMVIEQLNRVTLHVLTAVSSAHFPPYEAHPAAAPLRAAFCGRPPAPTGAAYLRRARAEGHGGARPLRERRAGIRAVLRRCQSRRRRREAAGAQRAERGHARSGAERREGDAGQKREDPSGGPRGAPPARNGYFGAAPLAPPPAAMLPAAALPWTLFFLGAAGTGGAMPAAGGGCGAGGAPGRGLRERRQWAAGCGRGGRIVSGGGSGCAGCDRTGRGATARERMRSEGMQLRGMRL